MFESPQSERERARNEKRGELYRRSEGVDWEVVFGIPETLMDLFEEIWKIRDEVDKLQEGVDRLLRDLEPAL